MGSPSPHHPFLPTGDSSQRLLPPDVPVVALWALSLPSGSVRPEPQNRCCPPTGASGTPSCLCPPPRTKPGARTKESLPRLSSRHRGYSPAWLHPAVPVMGSDPSLPPRLDLSYVPGTEGPDTPGLHCSPEKSGPQCLVRGRTKVLWGDLTLMPRSGRQSLGLPSCSRSGDQVIVRSMPALQLQTRLDIGSVCN